MGFKDGCRKAKPVLLEPIMKVEVVTPEDFLGDIIGDLTRRRGIVQGQEDSPSGKIVRAEVPLAEMFGYATSMRSATQGRATYSMEFEKYSETPAARGRGRHQESILINPIRSIDEVAPCPRQNSSVPNRT